MTEALNTFDCFRRVSVVTPDTGIEHRCARDAGEFHAGHHDVITVNGAARDDRFAVDARHSVTDVTKLRRILEPRFVRRVQCRCACDELRIVETPPGGGVIHAVIVRPYIGEWHAPGVGGSLLQHVSRSRARFTKRREHHTDGFRAVSVLVAVYGVADRLLERDPRKICFEFVGDDARQTGAHTLAHLAAADGDNDAAVGSHGNKDIRFERTARAAVGRLFRASDRADAEYEQAACRAACLQKFAARDLMNWHRSSSRLRCEWPS
jgi:hypothetical protein